MVPVVLVCGLILPANFSTAALILASGMILMYVGRIRLKYLLALAGAGLLLLVLFALVINISGSKSRLDTWESRIENYISGGDAEEDYQVDQAKIAIATGGVLGKSPGKSVQRNFLPHPYSDFIFAIIIEEYGLAGGLFLVLMYLILLFRGVRIATRSKTLFGSLLAFGITFLIVFQAFINMAVAVTLLPVTGQPLPMVSMGGTSLWATCISLGIVLSVSRESDKEEINETTEKDATA
jgi:cell division protein FtsW